MKKYVGSLIVVLISSTSFCQDLAFSVLNSDPAYCRTAGYQNGNGVLYAAVEGGVPAYSFLWTDLTTGATSTNSTWGGRNVGCYLIEVTDMEGTTISETICIDSLNPVANMGVISDDVLGGPFYFTGNAPSMVTFHNLSLNVPDPIGPDAEIRYYFKPHGLASAETSINLSTDFYYTYEFGGVWTASLVAKNMNGCTDTTHLTFLIDGPSALDEMTVEEHITVLPMVNANQLSLNISSNSSPKTLLVYDLSGKLILTQHVTNSTCLVDFNYPSGVYLYEVYDANTTRRIQAGKFIF